MVMRPPLHVEVGGLSRKLIRLFGETTVNKSLFQSPLTAFGTAYQI